MTLIFTKTSISEQKVLLENVFLIQFVLCLTSYNSTSRNVGGTDAWAVPPPQILGERLLPCTVS